MIDTEVETPGADPAAQVAAMRVLASGSAGNCTVLMLRENSRRRVCLIDLGLSPRRTRRLLESLSLSLDQVDDVFITHFDTDHFCRSWGTNLHPRTVVHVHERHGSVARRFGIDDSRLNVIHSETRIGESSVHTTLVSHDSEGVCAFRFEHRGAAIGFATDVGRATSPLIDLLYSVDALAVESNYCPRMQAASSRPAYLKARIMGGRGHLSNQQCAELVRQANPGRDVVLLHLSRQCNRPELAAQEHIDAPYTLTISSQIEPTPWVTVAGNESLRRRRDERAARVQVAARHTQPALLFSPDP